MAPSEHASADVRLEVTELDALRRARRTRRADAGRPRHRPRRGARAAPPGKAAACSTCSTCASARGGTSTSTSTRSSTSPTTARTTEPTSRPTPTPGYGRCPSEAEHGGPFAYNSLATDVLGWVLARAGGAPVPQLFSDCLWARSAPSTTPRSCSTTTASRSSKAVSARRSATSGASGSCGSRTARWEGGQVVPAAWIARLSVRDQELIDAYGEPGELGGPTADAFYHDNWWIWDAQRGGPRRRRHERPVPASCTGRRGRWSRSSRPSPTRSTSSCFALHHAGIAALCESLG